PFKQWMGLMRFAVKFGVKLAGDEERMLRKFDDLYESAVGSKAAESEISFLEALTIRIVELIAMPVAFVDDERSIEPSGFCLDEQLTRLSAEAHRASLFSNTRLLVEHGNHGVGSVRIELGRMRLGQL